MADGPLDTADPTHQYSGSTSIPDAQLQAWFQQYLGRPATDAELAQYRSMPEAEAAIKASAPPAAAPPPTPTPTSSGGFGGGGSTVPAGSLTAPFTEAFNPPGNINQGGGPGLEFLPPAPQFKYPTYDDMLKDPGYQFRMQQGEQALEQSAAGRGVINTGGTLKDILNYGQSAGSQEFGNMWNRNLDAYNAGVANWKTLGQAGQRASELNYDRAYQKWLSDYNMFRNQKNDTFDAQFKVTGA